MSGKGRGAAVLATIILSAACRHQTAPTRRPLYSVVRATAIRENRKAARRNDSTVALVHER